jgi:hypothetical protein
MLDIFAKIPDPGLAQLCRFCFLTLGFYGFHTGFHQYDAGFQRKPHWGLHISLTTATARDRRKKLRKFYFF